MADLDKDSVISKTELKKDSKKIQEFGRRISELTINNIEAFKFPSNIYEATIDLKNIKSNSAKKRQVQYLGKLLREIDLTDAFLIMKQLKMSSQKEIQRKQIKVKPLYCQLQRNQLQMVLKGLVTLRMIKSIGSGSKFINKLLEISQNVCTCK